MAIPGDPAYLASQRAELLRFARGAQHPLGFGWLTDDGTLDPTRPVELWITCRMTHVFALGVLVDEPPLVGGPDRRDLLALAAHGVRSIKGPLRDQEHGGWFSSVSAEGPIDASKRAYAHAFVVLAAASAVQAGAAGGDALLEAALDGSLRHFWDDEAGLSVEDWDRSWITLDHYRGVNANMHTVEAYLAAGDVTGDPAWHQRAGRIARHVVAWATGNGWRIPEHFDESWVPLLDFNRDRPADPFRPYGATVGHGLEWARLLLAAEDALGAEPASAGTNLREAAIALYDRAITDGWAVDGADGFVYTTDWAGHPVVRERMHWVAAEAANTATVLHRVTGDERYAADAAAWWAYIDRHLVDHQHGSWRHELDPQNHPSATVWSGKPDIYHAYQAALLPELPLAPSFAGALASRDG